ncbi:beta-1,3-galactosyltransferase 1-like [Galendromus occidentalis]|uniref:Hexosyltransferase n=1 Tax=Galendromus occidentalis TaxID=34638 RepID=A0AAJ6QYE9_9ACAR|nr:beta-1,3-galactosyltransferase 1-like [Galendromus occidentalis]
MDNSTRYNYNFRMLVEPRPVTCPSHLYAIVPSAPKNIERRRAIRRTWAKDVQSRGNSRLIFSLGKSNDRKLDIDLKYEQETHEDVLVFDFEDSYENATLKTVLSVGYAARCRPAYFLKADDDTYVNVERLLASIKLIEGALKEPFFAGQVHYRAKPHRTFSKWTVDYVEYPEYSYPPYISGNLYVISGSLLPSVAATAMHTRHLHLEDVFMTGLVATKLMVPRVSIEGIWDLRRATSHNCAYDRFVSGHYIEASLMERIHDDRRNLVQSCISLFFLSWCRCVPKITEIFVV